ncbi:hypothetical protein VP01_61g8 [Puccinia sorghi]|uniref:Uncharacterized protein n=1 Tax=Puccinia sorghi TaxID=27349 RepID=A0A0L6UIS5_9BASI|nr:hypothetical protein VP01_61g8 [Puccinia sorghi]
MTSSSFTFLPSVTQILSQVPPGEDPFSFGLRMLDASVYPTVNPKTFSILIVLSFIHACTIILSILVIMLPFLRPNDGRKRFWIVKKFTIGSIANFNLILYVKLPIITGCLTPVTLALAFFQLLIGCVCEVYTYLEYLALKSTGFANKMSIGVWIQFIWLCNFYSYFITSWGAISTCLGSPQPSTVLRSPIWRKMETLHAVCIITPMVVTMFTLAWSVALSLSYSKIQATVDQLRVMLIAASSERKSGGHVDSQRMLVVLEKAMVLLDTTRTLIFRLKCNSLLWSGIWSFTAAMYTSSVWPLITMFRTCYQRMEEMKTNGNLTINSPPSEDLSKREGTQSHENFGAALRRSYSAKGFLMCHCAMMTISIIYNFCICVVVGVHSEQIIVISEWRALGSWLFLVGGAFSAIAMVSQTVRQSVWNWEAWEWRSYIKFEFTQEVSNHHETGSKTNSETSHKQNWNAMASVSSRTATAHSGCGLSVGKDKRDNPDDVLIICIPGKTKGKIKAESYMETLRG